MTIALHLFWGVVVFLSAVQIGRGIATCGEWIGKSLLRAGEKLALAERERRLLDGRRGRP